MFYYNNLLHLESLQSNEVKFYSYELLRVLSNEIKFFEVNFEKDNNFKQTISDYFLKVNAYFYIILLVLIIMLTPWKFSSLSVETIEKATKFRLSSHSRIKFQWKLLSTQIDTGLLAIMEFQRSTCWQLPQV